MDRISVQGDRFVDQMGRTRIFSGINLVSKGRACDGGYDFAERFGEREFAAIAVVGGKNGDASDIFPPCGVCRQVMQEFCGPDFEIHMQKAGGGVFTVKLPELLPFGFTKDSMEA